MPDIPNSRIALAVGFLALALPTGVVAAGASVAGSATVDGDAANPAVSATQRQVDLVNVRAPKSWIREFTTTWTAGVDFKAVGSQRAQRIATIETVVSKNTGSTAKHDLGEPGEQGTSALTELWISAKHGRTTLTLRPKLGIADLRVTLHGGTRPQLKVSHLPAGTFRVTFQTQGRVGSSVLQLRDGCPEGALPMESRTAAALAGGATAAFTTVDTSVVCDGKARPVAN